MNYKHLKLFFLTLLGFFLINLQANNAFANEGTESLKFSSKGASTENINNIEATPLFALNITHDKTYGVPMDEGKNDEFIGVPIGKNVYEHYGTLDQEIYYWYADVKSEYWYVSRDESYGWLAANENIFSAAVSAGAYDIPMVARDKGDRYLPVGEVCINAYFALFSARPESTYLLFAKARSMLKQIEDGKLADDLTKINVIVTSVKEDSNMFSFGYYPSPYMKYGYGFADAHISDPSDKYKGDRVTRWRTEEARLLEIHRAVTEYSVVKNLTTNYITLTVEATQDKNWNEAVRNSYLLDILVNDLKKHPDKDKDEDFEFIMETYNKWNENNFPKWRNFVNKTWKEFYDKNEEYFLNAIAIPEPAARDAKLEAQMIEIAKTIW